MPSSDRRTFLKGLLGSLAVGGIGTAGGHPGDDDHTSFNGSHDIHRHKFTEKADLVGFHTLGGVGSESVSGGPENPLYGMVTDTWVEGDIAYVAIQTSSEPTGNRGVAVVDVSAYTRARSRAELDRAEMTVLSYIGNETEAGTANTARGSDDGKYLAYSKQAIGATYGRAASASTDAQDAPGGNVTGAEVYDVSDPSDPEYIGSAQGPNVGFHNCFVHQIGGDHYLFGIQGAVPGDAGVHIYRIDDDEGVIPVNFWGGDDVPVTDWGFDAAEYYCHDFYAHHDPETGRPLGFVAYWGNGGVVLDLSDPTDITGLGAGAMPRTHYVQPAPAIVGGKRLLVGGQEYGDRSAQPSGRIRVWDADDIFEEGFTECPELDTWTLYDSVDYGDYDLTPHNFDVTEDGWITQSHQHAGVRFLKIQPPGEGDVDTDEWHIAGRRVRALDSGQPITQETDADGEPVDEFETDEDGVFTSGYENARLAEAAQAYYRSHVEVPDESKTEADRSPDFWSARIENGVTFGASQNTGFYAIAADPVPVATRTPADPAITRTTSSSVFTGGQYNLLEYDVRTDATVRLRDRIPSGWNVVEGEVTTTDTGDGVRVEFNQPVDGRATRRVLVRVDEGVDAGVVGPLQYSTAADPSLGGKDWETVAESVESAFVGPSQ